MNKVKEAQDILKTLGLPKQQQNELCALTLLSLADLKESDPWINAQNLRKTLSKEIIEFVNQNYNKDYKVNTRESFRKIALNPFIKHSIVDLNPDNPSLPPSSAKTHYALTNLALNTIRLYNSEHWQDAVINFQKNQFPENYVETALIKRIIIKNYKSIFEDEIELGRVNLFIGANGAGKTNILEALAMIASSKSGDLDNDGLFSRGVRIAKPTLTFSSFLGEKQEDAIDVSLVFEDEGENVSISSSFVSTNLNDIYAKWIDNENIFGTTIQVNDELISMFWDNPEVNDMSNSNMSFKEFLSKIKEVFARGNIESTKKSKYERIISDYLIYSLNTGALRGLFQSSKKLPLGTNGEGLDTLIANLNSYEFSLLDSCHAFFDWLRKFSIDTENKLHNEGHKLGKSSSLLMFEDKFMQKKNNVFSAENANEGILHVLFYLTLFASNKTPKFFAIDNIETALNPRLGRRLIKEIAKLAKLTGKQVLITTHNPAILDGLNLNDDEQRLFEVYRTDEGHTKTRRIKFKPDLSDKQFKLSEMWMKGLLGAVSKSF